MYYDANNPDFTEEDRKLYLAFIDKQTRGTVQVRRRDPSPPQRRAVLTDSHRFASLATGMVCGDERQSPADRTPRRATGATVDLGNADAIGFKGIYDLEESTRRIHSPHVAIVCEYDTRMIGSTPYYWDHHARVWSTKPPLRNY